MGEEDTDAAAVKRRIIEALDGRPQTWLAEQTGDSEKNVQRWVGGTTAPPFDFVGRVAVALNVTTDWLLVERLPKYYLPPTGAELRRALMEELTDLMPIVVAAEESDVTGLLEVVHGVREDIAAQAARRKG